MATNRDIELDILTTEPNRYVRYKPDIEEGDTPAYSVVRVALPDRREGLKGQIASFGQFARLALRHTPKSRYDIVVATSSRLMTAVLGAYLAKKTKAAFYLDIRDIFVETISDVFPGELLAPVRKVFSLLERWAITRADRLNLVSEGFLPYFRARYRRDDYRCFTNGIDAEFASMPQPETPRQAGVELSRRVQILYAGNIGDGQGLERILPGLAERLAGVADVTVIGDGNTRQKLQEACASSRGRVQFIDAVPRTELIEAYRSADVLFLHLNNLPAFTRVLPSKLFEYAATGKPVLAGLLGYSRDFVEAELEGAAVFDPCDVDAAESAFRKLSIRHYDRSDFVQRYLRSSIMNRMARDIIALADKRHA